MREGWFTSLNPFEVREVLQGLPEAAILGATCLNPFEVREVLQARRFLCYRLLNVSIPLKSGRCCKSALQN